MGSKAPHPSPTSALVEALGKAIEQRRIGRYERDMKALDSAADRPHRDHGAGLRIAVFGPRILYDLFGIQQPALGEDVVAAPLRRHGPAARRHFPIEE